MDAVKIIALAACVFAINLLFLWIELRKSPANVEEDLVPLEQDIANVLAKARYILRYKQSRYATVKQFYALYMLQPSLENFYSLKASVERTPHTTKQEGLSNGS